MLIVLEGPDGSGTTLHSRLLAKRLEDQGKKVLLTAEPTDGPIGTFIREALQSGKLSPDTLQLLFCADRSEHIARVIAPAMQEGKIVVTDRYISSTLAYGRALGLDEKWLLEVNKNFIQPDGTLFLLPPLEVALERLRKRSEKDILENEDLQARVHESYGALAKANTAISVIDTSAAKDEVAERIWNAVNTFL